MKHRAVATCVVWAILGAAPSASQGPDGQLRGIPAAPRRPGGSTCAAISEAGTAGE
ncbi:MAG: hypothetical protein ACT4QD_10060 [Acidobacteriota bacterium]